MKEKEQLEFILHKINGIQQVLGGFTRYIEEDIKNDECLINKKEMVEYCAVITSCLQETNDLIKKIMQSYKE